MAKTPQPARLCFYLTKYLLLNLNFVHQKFGSSSLHKCMNKLILDNSQKFIGKFNSRLFNNVNLRFTITNSKTYYFEDIF